MFVIENPDEVATNPHFGGGVTENGSGGRGGWYVKSLWKRNLSWKAMFPLTSCLLYACLGHVEVNFPGTLLRVISLECRNFTIK